MEEMQKLKECPAGSPEEVLSEILRRLGTTPAPAGILLPEPQASAPPPAPGLAAILTAKLVRCADCRHVHYRSTAPPRGHEAEPWKEWLECDYGLTVTVRDLETRNRYCTLFNCRPASRERKDVNE
jgi:hypothetical protein